MSAPLHVAVAAAAQNENCQTAAQSTTSVTASVVETGVGIRLSELLVNPAGTDTDGEFIEIRNADLIGPLSGWSLENASGKRFALDGVTLAAGAYIALPYSQTKVTLANTGGTVSLLRPDGSAADAVTYGGDGAEGASYARSATDAWQWTAIPSPGNANIFASDDVRTEPIAETPAEAPSEPVVNEPTSNDGDDAGQDAAADVEETCPCDTDSEHATADHETPILDAHSLENGATVRVRGVVTLAPGRAGKTLFALAAIDGSSGTYVRMYGDGHPDLAAGDVVTVDAKVTRVSDALRLNASTGAIDAVGTMELSASATSIAELTAEMDGVPVRIAGISVGHGAKWIALQDDAGNEVRASFDDERSLSEIPDGSTVRVSGVLRFKNGIAELLADSAPLSFDPPAPTPTDSSGGDVGAQALDVATPAGAPNALGSLLALSPVIGSLGFMGWRRLKTGGLGLG